ncbi:cyclin-dependent protein kinase complex component [Aspergillus eucalypticola CBS 122712]|uniref:Cyclin-dependent protein kinase complex component n=1 Tax=Aspergillus eucalypticola (strain CBS 122712 / IBT 29274) TaxID=1448314 RepID=A0A317UVX0_ASPEC|nr:cyclin-dependent protein kinase complex component [Aspergillus eucalypticola CBS 122712]PWY65178.1 cyclin-dependent protein kinase complex component [Aspergillus eucalypticola CBS 122712]
MNKESPSTVASLTEATNTIRSSKEDESTLGSNYPNDVFQISPTAALGLLCTAIEMLVESSAEEVGYSRGAAVPVPGPLVHSDSISSGESTPIRVTGLCRSTESYDEAGRHLKQQSVLSKRFSSKRQPPITLQEYLLRMHKFCPMSTGVYLATSMYIMKMATIERVIVVSRKNMHRLVLAGLRVAMKSLEDLSYPHSRVAKVGGVTERELSRLEISFCFLADFELRVDADMLVDQVRLLRQIGCCGDPLR